MLRVEERPPAGRPLQSSKSMKAVYIKIDCGGRRNSKIPGIFESGVVKTC